MLLLYTQALASSPEGPWIATDVIAVGMNDDGSMCNPTLGLCLLADPDGDSGPVPLGDDWLFPGNAFEVWSATYTVGGVEVAVVNGGPYLPSASAFSWDSGGTNAALTWIHGSATGPDLAVEAWVEAPWSTGVVWLTLAFTATAPVTDLRVARVVDADPDAWSSGSYESVNDAGEGWAVASGTFDDRALALAAVGGIGGLCDWCTLAKDLLPAPEQPGLSDGQVGVGVEVGSLAPGDTVRVTFAYAVAIGADAAVALAMDAAANADHDGDGVEADLDCDDRDPARAPGQPEVADGIDNNCDGAIDEDSAATDDDGDGYTEASGDCDDTDALVYPGAPVASGSSGDADCDGVADVEWAPQVPADVAHVSGEVTSVCGNCATGAGVPTPLAAALAAAMFARRRGTRPARAAGPR